LQTILKIKNNLTWAKCSWRRRVDWIISRWIWQRRRPLHYNFLRPGVFTQGHQQTWLDKKQKTKSSTPSISRIVYMWCVGQEEGGLKLGVTHKVSYFFSTYSYIFLIRIQYFVLEFHWCLLETGEYSWHDLHYIYIGIDLATLLIHLWFVKWSGTVYDNHKYIFFYEE